MTENADQRIYEFSYVPTVKEAKSGSALMSRGLYPGIWLKLCQLHGIVLGLAFGIAGFATTVLIFKAIGMPIATAPLIFYGLGLLIGIALMVSGRFWHGRSAAAYQRHTADMNQTMRLSREGIVITSELVNLSYDWGAFRAMEQNKLMTTLLLGNTGFILPNRLLEQAGDVAEITVTIRDWFDAARTQDAS